MKVSLLTYELKCFDRAGEPMDTKPVFYRAADSATYDKFQKGLMRLFNHELLYAGGVRDDCCYEDWMLPKGTPTAELWNGEECAVRITMDSGYLLERTEPIFYESLDLVHEYLRQREGFYFDAFFSDWNSYVRNDCEAEYMEMFNAALQEYERRTSPGNPVEVVWQPKLYMDGFYRPLELSDLQDFINEQGEFHTWYNAPYQLVWDKNNHNHPYGPDISQASKEGTVSAVMKVVEQHTIMHRRYFKYSNRLSLVENGTVQRMKGRDNCVMHLTNEWSRYTGYDRKLLTVCAEVFNEDKPDYAAAPAIVNLLDEAIARFDENQANGQQFQLQTLFV